MNQQYQLFPTLPNVSDVVYTPEYVAKDIISWLNPKGVCLDPCVGDGSFYNNFPSDKMWCEITKGKDFFDFNHNVDWIIGNPPYSIFEDFLIHSFNIANEVAYLVPTNKIFQRLKIMNIINKFGGIKGIRIYGSGQNIGFPFGFSVGVFYFSKNYNGQCDVILNPTIVKLFKQQTLNPQQQS